MWTIDQDFVKDEQKALDRWYHRRSRILHVPGDHTKLEQSFNDFQDVVKGKYVKTMATVSAVETIPTCGSAAYHSSGRNDASCFSRRSHCSSPTAI
jgi:hypothetical protein